MDSSFGPRAVTENAAHPAQLLSIVERLKDEHKLMQSQLMEIRAMANTVYSLQDCSEGMCELIKLQDRIISLLVDLDHHSEWEEEKLFPLLHSYFDFHTLPSISHSLEILEKDHELAKQFVQSYVDGVNAMEAPIDHGFLKEMSLQLIQACLILLEHFLLEEELIFPLIDQIMTDADYLSS